MFQNWAEVMVWESLQKLISRGSIGDDTEEDPHENGRSLREVNGSSDCTRELREIPAQVPELQLSKTI